MAANAVHLTRPLSVAEISEVATDFPYDDHIPFRMWIRSADHILKQAQSYHRDEEYQQAYIFYLRHAILLLDKLSKHPQAAEPANRKALQNATRSAGSDLKVLEELKPRIAQRHAEYVKAQARRTAERQEIAVERARLGETDQSLPGDDHGEYQQISSVLGTRTQLAAEEHSDLALKLVKTESRRKKHAQGQTVEQFDGLGRSDHGQAHKRHSLKGGVHDLSRDIIDVGRKGQHVLFDRHASRKVKHADSVTAPPQYPAIPQKLEHSVPKHLNSLDISSTHKIDPLPKAPSLPPKEHVFDQFVPAVPSKIADASWESVPSRSETSTPTVDSRHYTFRPSAFTEDGTPLRTVWLPPQLRFKFLALASAHTRLNQEFLGILCGTLISNAFFITKLVIPQQTATSDTCEMIEAGEISLMEYCEAEDLMTLGWVHTHPTQTCFMSSRDLHTHSAYQLQLAESVAMVCAPNKDPSWGVFRLTSPPGLQHIRDCRQPGIFHPHALPDRELYTTSGMPSHVKELNNLFFEVVDLRD